MLGLSALVMSAHAQDPAYRPTRSPAFIPESWTTLPIM